MTHIDFNHLLSSIKTLTPEQVRQLRQQLDRQSAPPKTPTAPTPAKAAKRGKAATPQPNKRLTPAELDQYMLSIGLLSQLPDTDADYDDPEDEPITIRGEPLSETVIRERR
jgi:hypothetical protein